MTGSPTKTDKWTLTSVRMDNDVYTELVFRAQAQKVGRGKLINDTLRSAFGVPLVIKDIEKTETIGV